MTQEEAKELLPIITAHANGKTIQVFKLGNWHDEEDPNFASRFKWRIKPDPKLAPMTSDCFPPGMIWIKDPEGDMFAVTALFRDGTIDSDHHCGTFRDLEKEGILWSTDRKTWHSFMKEVQE